MPLGDLEMLYGFFTVYRLISADPFILYGLLDLFNNLDASNLFSFSLSNKTNTKPQNHENITMNRLTSKVNPNEPYLA